jgi:uncharacterized membrane protein
MFSVILDVVSPSLGSSVFRLNSGIVIVEGSIVHVFVYEIGYVLQIIIFSQAFTIFTGFSSSRIVSGISVSITFS